jgi:zinc protease
LLKHRPSFIFRFGCAPQNVEKLIASTLDEISKLQSNGPPQENIDKWRAEDKTSLDPQLKTNKFWLAYLNGQLQNRQDIGQINHYNDLRDAVKTDDVKALAAKYLSGEDYIRMVLMPENDTTQGQ